MKKNEIKTLKKIQKILNDGDIAYSWWLAQKFVNKKLKKIK